MSGFYCKPLHNKCEGKNGQILYQRYLCIVRYFASSRYLRSAIKDKASAIQTMPPVAGPAVSLHGGL